MRQKVFGEHPNDRENLVLRGFQLTLDAQGNGQINVGPDITNVEWDIFQISVRTKTFTPACSIEILHNGFFLCGSPLGSLDTATGPPDIVVSSSDELLVAWFNGTPHDLATVGVEYNENPSGTTRSTAH